ncbi:uncharacterized protein BYT42DRAFT_475795, partial [Radiomyces spectabilis]|uniref:uncharacterized protein n=1 Tax=Radiomyces spectabilis TaxID=64574 RepID=UPI00221EFFA7
EKYLTFLPHSGLHNQRLALINAMVLAKATNRTLIMPPVNIGKAANWRSDNILAKRLSECVSKHRSFARHCGIYRKVVPISVATVFDLTAVRAAGIRTIQRDDMDLNYFRNRLDLNSDDIYTVQDRTRFSYRIYDSRENQMDVRNYEQRINLEDLQARPERLIQFGSLFGTPRLALQRGDLDWLRENLFTEMGMAHPIVTEQALQVIGRLGGPGQFTSLHFRQGDGVFRATVAKTMARINMILSRKQDLNDAMTAEDEERITSIGLLGRTNDREEHLTQCILAQRSYAVHPRLQLIFMATDARQPRQTLPQLHEEYVCLFSLSDFPDILESTLTITPAPAEQAELYPSHLGPLLYPLIDAEIASYASSFIPTPKSTFSKYIHYRNQRFKAYY